MIVPAARPPAVVAVTTCHRRWDTLGSVVDSWKTLLGLQAVFVATHDTDAPPPGFDDLYVVEARAEAFHLGRLRNCAAEAVRSSGVGCEYLLFIDADILVGDPAVFTEPLTDPETPPDFVLDSIHALRLPDEGDRADPEHGDRGKRGTHLVRPQLFWDVNGYDQRLRGWGGEDLNLYARYRLVSARMATYDRERVTHLSHADVSRLDHNPPGEDLQQSLARNLRIHREELDPRGASWADDFGYPVTRIRKPLRPMSRG